MKKTRVLLIDDEVMFTRLVKLNLERTGLYEVRQENDGSKGYAAAKDFKPDVILLDIMMRECPGPEVARQIRADRSLDATRIIFVTATPLEPARTEDILGQIPFITKPAPILQIMRSIDRMCGIEGRTTEGAAA